MNPLLKKRLILALTLVIALFALHWVLFTSFINISLSSGDNSGSVTYKFLNQKSLKTVSVTTSSTHLKKRVIRGTYEVEVAQNNKSFFTIVKTRGLLTSKNVNAAMVLQKGRQFVGNNPSSCTQYIDGVLLSYVCGDYYSSIRIHVPATASLPTSTTTKTGTGVGGFVQGFIIVGGKSIALVQDTIGADASPNYSLFQVNNDLSVGSRVILAGLDASKLYYIQNYKTGFIVYNTSFSQVLYYSALGASPQKISLSSPKDSNLGAISLTVGINNTIAALYTSGVNNNSSKEKTEVVVNSSAGNQDLTFKGGDASAIVCATDRLCLQGSKNMTVYDISSGKPRELYQLRNVAAMMAVGNSFLVANESGILNLSIGSESGFYEFLFGDYKFDALQPAVNGYVLTLTNNQSSRVALYVNRTAADSDNIDQKIEQLQKMPGVSNVSIYGQYIYVLPKLGNGTLQSNGYFGYAPGVIQKANSAVQSAISKSGIDTTKYKIVNLYSNL